MRLKASDKREGLRLVEGSEPAGAPDALRAPRAPGDVLRVVSPLRRGGTGRARCPSVRSAAALEPEIPPRVRQRVVDAALAAPERTPRELAWAFTDREGYCLSESSVSRILKAYDLIASPAFVVLSAGKTFQHPTHRPTALWPTAFTYLHVVGGGWYSRSTVLDDDSRDILAWTRRPTMQATDVMETLDLARGGDRRRAAFDLKRSLQRLEVKDGDTIKRREPLLPEVRRGGKVVDIGCRWMDNVFIERLWRSLKYECVYLSEFATGSQARTGIGLWMDFYDRRRPHSALNDRTPQEAYTDGGTARKSVDEAA